MKRVHVFEFEDAPWFPSWLRTSMTNVIVVFSRLIGVPEALSKLVCRALDEQGLDRIVDLGSGAGGIMPDVVDQVRKRESSADACLLMTDLYPNDDALRRFDDPARAYLRYEPTPVDATDFASTPPGLKTMVNCFHHMRPKQARKILESAQANRQPLLIYEMGENKIPFFVWCLALPLGLSIVWLMCLALTPMVRPLAFRQVFFTYVIPLVPFFYAWDGQASMPRIYDFDDMDELLDGLGCEDYVWEKGHAKTPRGPKSGTYLLGLPR